MKRRYAALLPLLLVAAPALPALPAAPRARAAAPAYHTITDLGTLGGDSSYASGINSAGQVVGESAATSGDPRAFRRSGGVMTDLGVLPAEPGMPVWSGATAIDAAGRAVGWARVGDNCSSAVEFGDTGPRLMTGLGLFSGATDANSFGQIVGQGGLSAGSCHAFLWTADAGMRVLGTLGGAESVAYDFNTGGLVVGSANTAQGMRAFVWSGAAGMHDLGTLPDFVNSRANAINASGVAVGEVFGAPQDSHAAFFHAGAVIDLNDMLPTDAGWLLTMATDINDGGQIIGVGAHDGQTRGSLLTPTGDPGTFWDIGPAAPHTEAVAAPAARGIVFGMQDGSYRPGAVTQRAQLAAPVARAIPGMLPPGHVIAPPACLVAGSWDCEDRGNDFTDRDGLAPHLWRNVGTLRHYGVARGYDAATFGPNDPLTHAQAISLIARALVAAGVWEDQPGAPLPYPGVPAAHAGDIRTFVHYTGARGGVPDADATWDAARWDAGAARGWIARALWAAIRDIPAQSPVP